MKQDMLATSEYSWLLISGHYCVQNVLKLPRQRLC